ncbi:MAG: hypothetical protein A2580_18035 [Hydrogenophilales bacterium RIFOXYD1_FULL_62_11]|nr:MAG: hypothetical protein A2580_18035 [Hydrogenophilales bacterium RIFOXYD1_FULL_62_11]
MEEVGSKLAAQLEHHQHLEAGEARHAERRMQMRAVLAGVACIVLFVAFDQSQVLGFPLYVYYFNQLINVLTIVGFLGVLLVLVFLLYVGLSLRYRSATPGELARTEKLLLSEPALKAVVARWLEKGPLLKRDVDAIEGLIPLQRDLRAQEKFASSLREGATPVSAPQSGEGP